MCWAHISLCQEDGHLARSALAADGQTWRIAFNSFGNRQQGTTTNLRRKTSMFAKRLIFVVVLVCTAAAAYSAVPPIISYQGKLSQPSGAPVADGTYSVRFAIYDEPTGAHVPLWSETNPNVQAKGGLFGVMLGSVVNLPGNVFDSPSRFFGIKVGDDPEMVPRQQIASVAFAFKAEKADIATTVPNGAITTGKIAERAVTADNLADGGVTTEKLASGAVNTAQIADGAVTAAKMEAQEAWQEVGSIGKAAFQNGWSNYGNGFDTVAYMKDTLGFVHIKGLVRGGIISEDVAVFTLPIGYRPALKQILAGVSPDPTLGRVNIGNTGIVSFQPGGGNNA